MRGRAAITLTALAALPALAGVSGGDAIAKRGGKPDPLERPNIVVVMTDDQTVESLRVMPQTDELLADEGVTFTNNFASNPICCPSRSTFLTGQYAHNHGVLRNGLPNGGYSTLDGTKTLPVWLQSAGYYTAHIGKYLNGYGRTVPTEIPPGWSEWRGSIDGSTYSMHGYTLNENGVLTTYGDPDVADPATYQTDVYAAKAQDLIARRAPRKAPFFLSVAPLAPHSESDLGEDEPPEATPGPRAAPRHEGAFATEPLPLPPSFNETDVADKPAAIQALNPIGTNAAATIAARYRDRIESLLALDDMVKTIVETLRETGELDETLIVFTADNGFFHGEHRVRNGKQRLYEESIRVPLIMRGPGILTGKTRSQTVANVDLAPTILDFAGAEDDVVADGLSLRPLASDPHLEPGRGILLENWCGQNETCFDAIAPRYQAVRTPRYVYAEHITGEAELYDLELDPYELDSRHDDPAYAAIRGALSRLLTRLRACIGDACRGEPRLKLDLAIDGKRRDGKRCTSKPVRAGIEGAEADEALAIELFADGRRAGGDGEAPLAAKVSAKKLSEGGETDLRVNATVLDSREVSLDARLPRRC